jgi:uncharacterized protein
MIMRRTDREITDIQEILEVLKQAEVCRIALIDNDIPYIVPLNFGFETSNPLVLYFHCAPQGRKLDIIRKNNKVCFEVEVDTKIISGIKACDWSMEYRSVIGFGVIQILESMEEKIHGLSVLMKHYSDTAGFEFDPNLLNRTTILKLFVSEISGKEHITRRKPE